mmetsp:Transcript_137650/g.343547  ORF Transcript_137650/g.343547 Transcript_137650/m.343547 type:complete len:268 (-) Transcript_137650:355-1158(-)
MQEMAPRHGHRLCEVAPIDQHGPLVSVQAVAGEEEIRAPERAREHCSAADVVQVRQDRCHCVVRVPFGVLPEYGQALEDRVGAHQGDHEDCRHDWYIYHDSRRRHDRQKGEGEHDVDHLRHAAVDHRQVGAQARGDAAAGRLVEVRHRSVQQVSNAIRVQVSASHRRERTDDYDGEDNDGHVREAEGHEDADVEGAAASLFVGPDRHPPIASSERDVHRNVDRKQEEEEGFARCEQVGAPNSPTYKSTCSRLFLDEAAPGGRCTKRG